VHENNAEKYKKIFLPKKVLKNKKIVPVLTSYFFPLFNIQKQKNTNHSQTPT